MSEKQSELMPRYLSVSRRRHSWVSRSIRKLSWHSHATSKISKWSQLMNKTLKPLKSTRARSWEQKTAQRRRGNFKHSRMIWRRRWPTKSSFQKSMKWWWFPRKRVSGASTARRIRSNQQCMKICTRWPASGLHSGIWIETGACLQKLRRPNRYCRRRGLTPVSWWIASLSHR